MEEIPLPNSRSPFHDYVISVRGTPVVGKLPLPKSKRLRNCGITIECVWYGHLTILNLEEELLHNI
jgi:hypothetical protein